MRRFFYFLLDQLFPLRCLGCGHFGVKICDKCLKEFSFKPKYQQFGHLKVWSAFEYGSKAARLVEKWKFNGDRNMINLLISKITWPEITTDAVTFIPLHKKRLAERGFNQAEQLAEIISRQYEKEPVNLLTRVRNTKQQSTLDNSERVNNVKGAFKSVRVQGLILLIDDVVTTGSTLKECSKALIESGAQNVEAVCLFRARN